MSQHPPLHLAIGAFDGVHLGHRTVLHSAREQARRDGGLVGVMTFDPHPSRILRPDKPVPLLFTRAQKDERLTEAGAQFIHHQTFNAQYAAILAQDFPAWLMHQFKNLRSIHIGNNFHYGQNRQGNAERLVHDAKALGLSVHSCPAVEFEGDSVSSSRIRGALIDGNIELANRLLLRPYEAEGVLIEGQKLGRTIGYPTLNMAWSPELQPAFGVYAVECIGAEGIAEPAVANWGVRPTVEKDPVKPLLESHLLKVSGTLPQAGDTIRVRWLYRIRGEKKFESLDDLKAQIAKDEIQAKKLLGLT
ncbi:MAG: riboflavin biosynthesis protein RibF [Opitutia bacterium]|nr:riboflavin biosynthesis protein RibF [Opitutales bacterium]PHX68635.1 MAG: riboflavin biosynthesis protein RibF [Opitutae bacterium]